MKIIGIQNDSHYGRTYVAIVSHGEVNSVFDAAYGKEVPPLKVGDEINLADGARFRNEIKRTCESMTNALQNFKASAATMTEFTKLVATLPSEPEQAKPAAQAAE